MLTLALISLTIFYITAVAYVAVMHFKQLKDNGVLKTLHWSSKTIGYTTLYIGLVFDMLLNVLVMTVVMLELPKEVLTTSRVRRHKFAPSDELLFGLITSEKMQAYRYKLAIFMCKNYLEPFDNKHCS